MEFTNVIVFIASAVDLKILPPGYVDVIGAGALGAVIVGGVQGAAVVGGVQGAAVGEGDVDEGVEEGAEGFGEVVGDGVVGVAEGVGTLGEDNGVPPLLSDQEYEEAWIAYCLKISSPFMTYFDEKLMGHNCMPLWIAAGMADTMIM